jgi:rod shape-determining protein MreD
MQVSVMPNFFSSGSSPDLLIILLIFFTAETSFSAIWKWAIFGGLATDIIFFTLPGTNAVSFLAIAYATEALAKRFLAGQRIWKIFILALVASCSLFFDNALTFLLAKTINYFYDTNYHEYFSFGASFRNAFMNFILAIILYWPFRKMKNLIFSRQEIKL